MEKKREGDREAAGEVFLSSDPLYHCFFWYWGWERGAAKVAKLEVWRRRAPSPAFFIPSSRKCLAVIQVELCCL
jgi:hypothetical protein